MTDDSTTKYLRRCGCRWWNIIMGNEDIYRSSNIIHKSRRIERLYGNAVLCVGSVDPINENGIYAVLCQ
jgi:hypothetical protein